MILLDKPYVSDFLLETIRKNNFSVVGTPETGKWFSDNNPLVVSPEEAVERIKKGKEPVYSNSENAIGWIEKQPELTYLKEKVNLFKNKVAFRELLQKKYPDYFFQKVLYQNIKQLDIAHFPFPFIIKPSVGFFSMGVYKVNTPADWTGVLEQMDAEIQQNKKIYPKEVYNDTTFIIEEVIEGDEIAVDCYINENKEAVVLNVMKHVFSSGDDVSDRLYFTSSNVIKEYLEPITQFLNDLAQTAHLVKFPMHVELRFDKNGNAMPIEVNPLRFGGWCTTADMAFYAFGINAYEHYLLQQQPDWDTILKSREEKTHCILILDNSTGYSADKIKSFDYDKLTSEFEKVWTVRKVNHHDYPLFGMLFVASESEKSDEVLKILHSDLSEFIQLQTF